MVEVVNQISGFPFYKSLNVSQEDRAYQRPRLLIQSPWELGLQHKNQGVNGECGGKRLSVHSRRKTVTRLIYNNFILLNGVLEHLREIFTIFEIKKAALECSIIPYSSSIRKCTFSVKHKNFLLEVTQLLNAVASVQFACPHKQRAQIQTLKCRVRIRPFFFLSQLYIHNSKPVLTT